MGNNDSEYLPLAPPSKSRRIPAWVIVWLGLVTAGVAAASVIGLLVLANQPKRAESPEMPTPNPTLISGLVKTEVARVVSNLQATRVPDAASTNTNLPPASPKPVASPTRLPVAAPTPMPAVAPQASTAFTIALAGGPRFWDAPTMTVSVVGESVGGLKFAILANSPFVYVASDVALPVVIEVAGIVSSPPNAIVVGVSVLSADQKSIIWTPAEGDPPATPGEYTARALVDGQVVAARTFRVEPRLGIKVVQPQARTLPVFTTDPKYVLDSTVVTGSTMQVVRYLKVSGIVFLEFVMDTNRVHRYIPVGDNGAFGGAKRYVSQEDATDLSEKVLADFFR